MTGTAKRRLAVAAGVIAFYAVMGLLNVGTKVTEAMAYGERGKLKSALLDEATGSLAAMLLVPITIWLAWNLPVRRGNAALRLPLHLAASALIGCIQTLMMWGSRTAFWSFAGWGRYDYGDMGYRFLMEYHKQFLGYWVVYFVTRVVAYARENRERELKAKDLERQLAEARLSALKSQLNPHFLFNTLNLISSLVHDEPQKADRMIALLSDFLRKTLEQPGRQEVPLEEELKFLEAYVAIMKARFEEGLAVEASVAPDAVRAYIPPLLLQPLVENAVKHSTASAGSGWVRIGARREGARLHVTVEDNGPGLTGGAPPAEGGVGLANVSRRLAALYGEDQTFLIENRPEGGLRAEVTIPYREAKARETAP